MPRKAKSVSELEPIKSTTNVSSSKKKAASSSAKEPKKTATTKKASTAKSTVKKEASTTKTTTKKGSATTQKTTTKKSTKTTTSKKTTTKKVAPKATTKRKTTSTTKKASKLTKKIEILEYYDLPYRYNETVVKILAQTPTTLFVYWDISDKDKENFIATFGEYFFNNTKPVLIIDNETMNYRYEIDINDFANSWYLHLPDSNCHYRVELGRRPINHYVSIPNDYLPISSSNEMITPNDHILFESIGQTVTFKNIKTNQIQVTSISSIVPAVYKNDYKLPIQKLFAMFYKKEDFPFTVRFSFTNPSSGNPTSTFK